MAQAILSPQGAHLMLARIFGDCREGEIPRSLLWGISLYAASGEQHIRSFEKKYTDIFAVIPPGREI